MNVVRFTISSKEWGDILVLRPLPKPDEPWGDLAPLRGTPWGDLLAIVSGANLSHALHGYATPLMREIGPHPFGLCRLVPESYRACRQMDSCIMASRHCVPGPKLPSCFVPPAVPSEALLATATVATAWAEGRYVLIVEGAEFSLSRGSRGSSR